MIVGPAPNNRVEFSRCCGKGATSLKATYNRAQRLLILDGEAGRGKTQFANVMQGLVGNRCRLLRSSGSWKA